MIHGATPAETCFAAPLGVSSNGNFQLVKAALCKNVTFHVIEVIMEGWNQRLPGTLVFPSKRKTWVDKVSIKRRAGVCDGRRQTTK